MSRRERAAAVISIDTELAWGEAHRRDGTRAGHRYEIEREVIGSILDLFERHGISATWAVVGHLFLDRCSREDGQAQLADEMRARDEGEHSVVDPEEMAAQMVDVTRKIGDVLDQMVPGVSSVLAAPRAARRRRIPVFGR